MENYFWRKISWWGKFWTWLWNTFKLRMKPSSRQNCIWKLQSCCWYTVYSKGRYLIKSYNFVKLPPPRIKRSTELQLNEIPIMRLTLLTIKFRSVSEECFLKKGIPVSGHKCWVKYDQNRMANTHVHTQSFKRHHLVYNNSGSRHWKTSVKSR